MKISTFRYTEPSQGDGGGGDGKELASFAIFAYLKMD